MTANKDRRVITKETEEVREFISLLGQISDDDRKVIKGMMMWAAGEAKNLHKTEHNPGKKERKTHEIQKYYKSAP